MNHSSACLRTKSTQSLGFTLIEVMVVIAILGLLTALVATNAIRHFQDAKLQSAQTDTAQILAAAKSYYVREGIPPSLEDLVEPPPELTGFTDVPLDPWNHEYEMGTDGESHTWFVASAGPDGEFDTVDDITSNGARRQRGG